MAEVDRKVETLDSRTSRRRFLKTAAAAAAVTWVAPRVAFPRSRERTDHDGDRVILGSGRHTYEVVKGWGKLPDSVKYGNTHHVQIDSHGRVYIHNMSKDSVCVFDPDGRFIRSWGEEYAAGAHGIQIRREGGEEFFYLASTFLHTVSKTKLDGRLIWRMEYPKECSAYTGGDRYNPTNIAFAPNGDFYVADGYGMGYIHHYNLKAEYVRSWGGPGTGPGQMNCPHGIWLDTRGREPLLVIADRENNRLQWFTLDGQYRSMLSNSVRRPCHFDQRHGEFVIPELSGRVTILDRNNEVACRLGENPDHTKWANNGVTSSEWVDGQFCSPHGACFDRHGNIYIVEWLAVGRVTKLRRLEA